MPLTQENRMVELKYSAKNFGRMDEKERELAAHQLLLKIHAIRGWTIPVSELMDVLVSEFAKKLVESYENVNEDEVMYAFRNTSLDVKDWGKAMNLSLIDEVMQPYLERRFDISKVEEQIKPEEVHRELTDEEMAEWLMEWKAKDEINIELIPIMLYDFMDRKEIIKLTKKRKWHYTELATQQIKSQLFQETSLAKTNEPYIEYNKFLNMEQNGFTGEYKGRILNRAKRLIVFDYLKDKL